MYQYDKPLSRELAAVAGQILLLACITAAFVLLALYAIDKQVRINELTPRDVCRVYPGQCYSPTASGERV